MWPSIEHKYLVVNTYTPGEYSSNLSATQEVMTSYTQHSGLEKNEEKDKIDFLIYLDWTVIQEPKPLIERLSEFSHFPNKQPTPSKTI